MASSICSKLLILFILACMSTLSSAHEGWFRGSNSTFPFKPRYRRPRSPPPHSRRLPSPPWWWWRRPRSPPPSQRLPPLPPLRQPRTPPSRHPPPPWRRFPSPPSQRLPPPPPPLRRPRTPPSRHPPPPWRRFPSPPSQRLPPPPPPSPPPSRHPRTPPSQHVPPPSRHPRTPPSQHVPPPPQRPRTPPSQHVPPPSPPSLPPPPSQRPRTPPSRQAPPPPLLLPPSPSPSPQSPTPQSPRKIIVGGSQHWRLGFDYNDWALKNGPFYLNDVLVFKYDPPNSSTPPHSVYVLPNIQSFNNCDLGNAKMVANLTQGSGDNGFEFVLKQQNPYYFACGEGTGFHCKIGSMKFSITPIIQPS